MNIVYSSDENYVQHMAVSILSLIKNNLDVQELNIFIISNEISDESKEKLNDLTEKYGIILSWIDFEPYKKSLVLDMEWNISISSYARLFLASMLPAWCERVIYIDCDTVVCDSLWSMWNENIEGYAIGGVKDLIVDDFKLRIGLEKDDVYINAGIVLINLKYWRTYDLQSQFVEFIVKNNGRVTHHDQGVMNGVLKNQIAILKPCYNAMTPYFTSKFANLICFYDLKNYYTEEEILEAVNKSVIIHFTPEFVGRVWEKKCKHPKAGVYRGFLDETVWKDNLVESSSLPVKLRILYWCYKNLPVRFLKMLLKMHK